MYLTPTVWLMIITIIIGMMLVVVGIIFYNKSFKNVARIARQTGKEPGDVIWINDRFRVKNTDGHWVIQFRHLREDTQSIDGKFWTKFVPSNKKISYTKDAWNTQQLSKHIQRGIYFYETTEGEFFPMDIIKTTEGGRAFRVLTQDNRSFLINQFKKISDLTRNKRLEMLTLGGIVAACLVLGIIFIFGMIYLNEASKRSEQSQAVDCANYARAVFNLTQTNDPTFLDSVTQRVTGATPGG